MDQGGTIDSGNKDKLPKFDKLNSLVMEPIPEKYQTRQTNQVYDTSQNLQKYAHYLRGAAKQMNLDSIDANKNGGKGRSLRVSLHSSIDMEEGKLHTPPSNQKVKRGRQGTHLKTIAASPNSKLQEKTLTKNSARTQSQKLEVVQQKSEKNAPEFDTIDGEQMRHKFQSFKKNPKLVEHQVYIDFEKHQRHLEALGPSLNYKEDTKPLNLEEIEKEKLEKIEMNKKLKQEFKKPLFYNNPQLKQKIPSDGGNHSSSIFEKNLRYDQVKQGYSKLLSKIQESNLTVRQIKNGQTLFDKEVMQKRYNNPFLDIQHLRDELKNYIDVTGPPSPNGATFSNKSTKLQHQLPQIFVSQTDDLNESSIHKKAPSPLNFMESKEGLSTTIGNSSQAMLGSLSKSKILAQKSRKGNNQLNLPQFNSSMITGTSKDEMSTNLMFSIGDSVNSVPPPPAQKQNSPQLLNFSPQNNSKILQEENAAIKSPKFSTQQRPLHKQTNFPPPFMIQKREKATEIMKKLLYPVSPAFVFAHNNKAQLVSPQKLENVIDFCHAHNIPFQDEEERYYQVNKIKQQQKFYSMYLDKCFETNRPSEFDIGLKNLSKKQTLAEAAEIVKERENQQEQKRDIFDTLHEKQPQFYMPKILKRLEKSLQEQQEISMQRMEFQRQLGEKKLSGMSFNRNLGQKSHNTDMSSIQKHHFSRKQGSSLEVGERVIESNMMLKQQQKKQSMIINPESQLTVPKFSTLSIMKSPINTPGGASNQNFVETMITQSDFDNNQHKENAALIDAHDQKRWHHITSHLPSKLTSPFIPKVTKQKRASKRDRSDPIRKIIQVNKEVQRKKLVTNQKLLAILERVEFDRPILLRDKLEIIWEQKEKNESNPPHEVPSLQNGIDIDEHSDYPLLDELDVQNPIKNANQQSKKKLKIVNEQGIKRELERRKLERQAINQKQMQVYKTMLEHLEGRFKRLAVESFSQDGRNERNNPPRVQVHEKERQFMEAFKLVISSGYTINQDDFMQILHFIDVPGLADSSDTQVIEFLKNAATHLSFDVSVVDQVFQAQQHLEDQLQQYTMDFSTDDNNNNDDDEFVDKSLMDKI